MTQPSAISTNTHRVNVLNLVPYHLAETFTDRWYGCCRAYVNQTHPWLGQSSGTVENIIIKKLGCNLREIQWDKNSDLLKEFLNMATQTNRQLFFGCHDIKQLRFLQKFLGNKIQIIALTYGSDSYEYLLEDLVRTHISMLRSKIITPSESDHLVLISGDERNIVEHYKRAFDSMDYIPRSCQFSGDYEIPFRDYFELDRMQKHFETLGFPVKDPKNSLYHQWFHTTQTNNRT